MLFRSAVQSGVGCCLKLSAKRLFIDRQFDVSTVPIKLHITSVRAKTNLRKFNNSQMQGRAGEDKRMRGFQEAMDSR